jgi:nucleoside-diphosphate-sugar epimerase
VRDYIHVSDVAQAFGDAVDASDFGRHTLNVGTGIATSNRRLLELARGATRTPAPRDVRSFSVASISSIRELYGFVPKVALESAMRFPARYFRSESNLPAERLRNRR